MKVIVVGCGRVGAQLANRLYQKGMQVTVIDESKTAFDNLDPNFRGRTLEGDVLAQDMLRHPYTRRGDISGYDPLAVQTLGLAPFQYAAGAMEFLTHAQPVSNVMIGSFGPEVGLVTEAGAREGLTQVAGSTDARALAMIYPTVEHVLTGEEVFAAPAYLERRAGHLGRLRAQDLTRFFLVAVIVVAALLRTLIG